jgi:disulfide bond formation protein DsbB
MLSADVKRARRLALLVPVALMAGALGSQFLGGLYPCEMCHWQRWPHYTAIGIALLAFLLGQRGGVRMLIALAALAVLTSGAIGVYHAGVEYKFWEGLTTCSSMGSGRVTIEDIMATPLIRCDEPQWTLLGISLAGFNALISIPAALYILNLVRRAK